MNDARFIIEAETTTKIQSLPNLSDNNIRVEVENLTAALAKNGMEVIVVNTMHPTLQIPAFYTIVPGAHFRERAISAQSIGLFCAKIIVENLKPEEALCELDNIDRNASRKILHQVLYGTIISFIE